MNRDVALLACLLWALPAPGQTKISLAQSNYFTGDFTFPGTFYSGPAHGPNTKSVSADLRSLFGVNGGLSVDFSDGIAVQDGAGQVSMLAGSSSRELDDNASNKALQWDNAPGSGRCLYDTDAVTATLDWHNKTFPSGWNGAGLTNIPVTAFAANAVFYTGTTNIGATSTSLVIAIGHTMPNTNYCPSVSVLGASALTISPTYSALTTTTFTFNLSAGGIGAADNLRWSAIYSP